MTKNMVNLVAHIYFSPLAHDSRVRRAMHAALEAGLTREVAGIGYHQPGLALEERPQPYIRIRRVRLLEVPLPRLFSRSIAWFVWSFYVVGILFKMRADVVQAHSLAAMPAAALVKLLTGAVIVYDAHELETERAGWGAVQRSFARRIERPMIRYANETIVVSKTIAEWYRDTYAMSLPALVRNMPDGSAAAAVQTEDGSTKASLRVALGLKDDDLLFVYLGAIGYGRGIGVILDAFTQVSPHRHFCAVGYGEMADEVKRYAAWHPNIHFHDAVPSHEVMSFIRHADVGFSLGEDVCLSYRYSLPNKIFETRLSGLPVIASDLPEMAGFVREYGGGWVASPDVESVVQLVESIDRTEIERVLAAAKPIPRWEEDKAVYVEVLRRAIAA
jgi:glycosyltransferase involved in cell wall biosynthesis